MASLLNIATPAPNAVCGIRNGKVEPCEKKCPGNCYYIDCYCSILCKYSMPLLKFWYTLCSTTVVHPSIFIFLFHQEDSIRSNQCTLYIAHCKRSIHTNICSIHKLWMVFDIESNVRSWQRLSINSLDYLLTAILPQKIIWFNKTPL